MEITYKITEISKNAIEEFPWIKSNFTLGELGSRDDREITRLLENTHYSHITKTLEQIDKYGSQSGEIGELILVCNDNLGFSRLLAELSLFIHLHDKLRSNVTTIRRVQKQKSPDLSVKFDDNEYLIEVYSPMDYYGYQTFSRLLTSCIKNLVIDTGFNISIVSDAQRSGYTYDFPQFRDVYDWLDQFGKNFIKWLKAAKVGDAYNADSPAGSVKLKIQVKSMEENPEIRSISWIEATRSTDTILYFRIDDPANFAETQWGIKIKDKLQQQQAGEPRDKVMRILAINFALAETSDLSFLNDLEYHSNFDKYIKFLASDINPYPPYDVVLPCELRFECGFAKPINLSSLSYNSIENSLSKICMNTPIKEIRVTRGEQVKAFWEFDKRYSKSEEESTETPNI
jgi:hypothetical protein